MNPISILVNHKTCAISFQASCVYSVSLKSRRPLSQKFGFSQLSQWAFQFCPTSCHPVLEKLNCVSSIERLLGRAKCELHVSCSRVGIRGCLLYIQALGAGFLIPDCWIQFTEFGWLYLAVKRPF